MTDEIYRDEMEEKAAFLGSVVRSQTMADSTLRVTIDLNPRDAVGAFTAFGSPGSPVAVARVATEVALEEGRPKTDKRKGPYGQFAKKLVQSGFFKSPDVWKGIGTDKEYLLWVKSQPSAKSRDFDYYENTGDRWCVAAHVRRVDMGSGTAHKPPYSAIPLTRAEHDLAHQKGDNAIGDDDWWRMMRVKYVEKWAYETLKDNMGYDSYTNIPPRRLVEWAEARDLTHYLPLAYINAATEEHQETSEA